MFLILLLLAPPALLWGFVALRGRSLLLLAALVVAAEVVVGPQFYSLPGLHAATINRLLWIGTMFLFGLLWYARFVDVKPVSRVDIVLFAFCGWVLVSALRGGPVAEDANPIPTCIFLLLVPLGLYWVTKNTALSRVDVRHVLYLFLALGTYLGIIAICEGAGWYGVVYPRFIADPTIVEFFGRARGPLLNPIGNGIYLGTTLVIAAVLIPRQGRGGRLVLILICGILLTAIYLTKTRSCWLSAIAGLCIATWTLWPRHIRLWGLTAAIVFASIGGVVLKDDVLYLKRDKHLSAHAAAQSAALRPLLAVVAWEMFKDHPIAGVGFRHYLPRNLEYTELRPANLPTEKVRPYVQHNVFLAFLVETGLVGAMLLCLVLFLWASQAFWLATDAMAPWESRAIGWVMLSLLSTYVINGMFHDISVIQGVNLLLFVFAGIAGGLYAHEGILPERLRFATETPAGPIDRSIAVPG